MIEYLRGTVEELTPATAIIDVGGVGYEVNISLTTFGQLQKVARGVLAKVLIEEIIREDSHVLFGFGTGGERDLFRELIGVSGVGANSARVILSSIPPQELRTVITQGEERRLKAVKGIGAKTAQRIIVDLRDKIKPSGDTLNTQPTYRADIYDEVLAALVTLGFPKPASQKVLTKLFAEVPDITVEQALKQALSMF